MKSIFIALYFLVFFIKPTLASEADVLFAIKNNTYLESLDEELNKIYRILPKILDQNEKNSLKNEQLKWLKSRNNSFDPNNPVKFLENSYKSRNTELVELLNKKFSPIKEVIYTGNKKINHSEALKVLESCDLAICNLYKAYFVIGSNQPLANKYLDRIDLKNLYNFNIYLRGDILGKTSEDIASLLARLNYGYGRAVVNNEGEFIRVGGKSLNDVVPLWLLLEHPNIFEELGERFSPSVIADKKLQDNPKFNNLNKHLDSLWLGFAYGTCFPAGSIYRDIAASYNGYLNIISFAPNRIINEEYKKSVENNLLPLKKWSYKGIWNRKAYLKFESLLDVAVPETTKYYEDIGLRDAAAKSRLILSSYVFYMYGYDDTFVDSPAFLIFSEQESSIDILKAKTSSFKPEDWNVALSIAILNHYTPTTIEWIISSGADVNKASMDEYPLMNAVDQPAIVKLLLQKGAKVDAETPYGKTALFYAVQFNQLETIRLLILAKADVNHKLLNKERLYALCEKDPKYQLDIISEFTPFVYSMRYASKEVQEYLINNGAKKDLVPVDKIESWIKEGGI